MKDRKDAMIYLPEGFTEEERSEVKEYCEREGFSYKETTKEDLLREECDAVILYDKTDLTSDVNEYYCYYEALLEKGVTLEALHDSFGTASMFEPILKSFTEALADFKKTHRTSKRRAPGERDAKAVAEKMIDSRAKKAKKGGYAGGRASTGYKAVDGRLVKDRNEAKAVEYIFGRRRSGGTLTEISNELIDLGYQTKRGKDFTPSMISSILKREMFYKGYYKAPDGSWVKGQHEPYLNEDGSVIEGDDDK